MPRRHRVDLPLLTATVWAETSIKSEYIGGSLAAFEAAEDAGVATTEDTLHLQFDAIRGCGAAKRDCAALALFLRTAQAVGTTSQEKLTAFLYAVNQYGQLIKGKATSGQVVPELYATVLATGDAALAHDMVMLFPPESLAL